MVIRERTLVSERSDHLCGRSEKVMTADYAIAPDKIKAEVGWYPETMLYRGY